MSISAPPNTWVWTNFTWQNMSVPQDRKVGWRIHYRDATGNKNKTNIMSFSILPNPVVIDNTPAIAYNGQSFTFNASISDTHGVSSAWVEYWYDAGVHTNQTMIYTGVRDYYERTITVALNLSHLNYIISANDTRNYWSNTGIKTISLHDALNPTWQNQGQNKTYVPPGNTIKLYAQGSDNREIDFAYLSTNETGTWTNYLGITWWDRSWTRSKRIEINHSQVAENLVNFPVLISVKDTAFSDDTQLNGEDFVFLDETNTTQCSHEIESYTRSTGELTAWVRIPLLSTTQDTILYLYLR